MSRLPDIQEAFQRYLLVGDPKISAHVVGTSRVPAETRLGIYGDGYRSRLVEALEANFPVLAELLGEGDFHTLASRYINSYESTFFSIRYYGDRLADFLAGDAEYSKAPLLPELARWEWAMAAAFDAADARPIEIGALAQVAPEDWAELRFEWSPAVQVLELEWNVPQLWKAVTEATERPDPSLSPASAELVDLAPRAADLLPCPGARRGQAIVASRAGQSFGELCVGLCEHLDESEASLQAAGFLRGWVQSGLIVE